MNGVKVVIASLFGRGRVARGFAGTCLCAAAVLGATQAWGIAYVTNDVYTVTSYSASSDRQQLNMYGGEIAFNNTGSYGFVRNVIRIDSPTDVTFVTTNSATPRPIDFGKDVFNPGGGQLVLSESARFGISRSGYNDSITWGRDMVWGDAVNRQPGATGYPYLSPDVIKFANPGDSLVLTGRLALTAWPTSCNYAVEKDSALALYGDNMISGDMIQDGEFTLPWKCLFWANPLCLPPTAKLIIPSDGQVIVIHTELDTATGNLSYPGGGHNNYSNDIHVVGELLVKAQYATTFHGDITGPSAGRINIQGSSANDNIKRFSGDLSGFNGWIRLYSSDGGTGTKINLDNKTCNCYLDKNAPAGGIRIFAASNTTTRCAFYPETAAARAGDWHVGRLQAEGVYETTTYGLRGANWYMLSRQNLTIDSLEYGGSNGGISITGATSTKNSSTLTIGSIQSGFELVIEKGVPVTIGSLGEGVKIRYYGTQVNTNAVNLAAGCTLGELEVPQGDTVYLNGGAVENVTGTGTLVVTGGDVRLGAVAATVDVQVRGGTVTFGSGIELSDVTTAKNLGFWMDPSDYSTMQGAYEGFEFWGNRGQGEGTTDILGTSTAYVYTNGFPLIERIYDKRSSQRVNFFWQDRCVDSSSAFYSYLFPFLMTDRLNGRSVLSFGEHANPMDAKWSNKASDGSKEEARRIPLMRGHATGGALRIYTMVMVFGSQNGGGRALVGGYDGNGIWKSGVTYGTGVSTNPACGGNYPRGGSGYGLENPIFSTYRDTWVDGAPVDPTTTPPSGGWQIISFNGSGTYFRSLGMSTASSSGGQNYGELLVFTNTALTAVQRQTVENYLAMKWGLADALSVKGSVTVAAGATVKGAVANVSGAGTWELDSPETRLALDGTSFAGTLASSGTVTVADAAYLPSFSPSFSGAAEVADGNLSFTYANGAFAPALVAPDADLTFPAAPTVTVTTGGALEAGDYPLVSGKTLTGLTDCTLVHDIGHGMKAKLVRTETALVLRVMSSGMTVIFR